MMQKFTVFSLILGLIVVIMVAEVTVDDYFPKLRTKDATAENKNAQQAGKDKGDAILPQDLDLSKTLKTSVLGVGEFSEKAQEDVVARVKETASDALRDFTENTGETPMESVDSNSLLRSNLNLRNDLTASQDGQSEENLNDSDLNANTDFEDQNFQGVKSVYLREEQLRSAGFIDATIAEEPHEDMFFKSLYVGDLPDLQLVKYGAQSNGQAILKAYALKPTDATETEEVYEILKSRATDSLNVEVNETNEFGDKSFYMNDARRPNVAFLSLRMDNLIYGFSYPKQFHQQVKNLIKLIAWEKGRISIDRR